VSSTADKEPLMYSECIIALFDETEKARLGLEILTKAGYGADHISIVTLHDDPAISDASTNSGSGAGELEKSTEDSKGVAAGAGVGGVLGGAFALPLAASTLLGPFILAGPLVGIGVGAFLGGMLGSSAEQEDTNKAYRENVEQGGVLIIVTGSHAELLDASASVKTAGPVRVDRLRIPHDADPKLLDSRRRDAR
jgi:hypothetical protein